MKNEYIAGKGRIEIVQGSITKYHADILVCPRHGLEDDIYRNQNLGCVRNVFLQNGGQRIFSEFIGFPNGKPKSFRIRDAEIDWNSTSPAPEYYVSIAPAGKLHAKYVILAECTDFRNDILYCDRETISRSTRNVLDLARKVKPRSLGFPLFGLPSGGIPVGTKPEDAVAVMSDEFIKELQSDTTIDRLGLVLYSEENFKIGKEVLDKKFTGK